MEGLFDPKLCYQSKQFHLIVDLGITAFFFFFWNGKLSCKKNCCMNYNKTCFLGSVINQVRVQRKVVFDVLQCSYCILSELSVWSLIIWEPVFDYTFWNQPLKYKKKRRMSCKFSLWLSLEVVRKEKVINKTLGWNICFLFS